MDTKDNEKNDQNKLPSKEDLISLAEASQILGITEGTVRNWAKLGRLTAYSSRPMTFDAKEVEMVHSALESGKRLSSRRNKTRAVGNFVPLSYIDSASPNHKVISSLLDALPEKSVPDISVIFYYAKELLSFRNIPQNMSDELLEGLGMTFKEFGNLNLDFLKDYPLSYVDAEDTLGMLYISLKNLRDKKSTGSYYTPYYVADCLIGSLGDLKGKSVCDPGCGTGNFLIKLPRYVTLDKIHGCDIDPVAVAITRINLTLRFLVRFPEEFKAITRNITVKNFLTDTYASAPIDLYIGNPPWGYNFSSKEIIILRHNYETCTAGARPESFAVFMERALKSLRFPGEFSFVLPESLLESGLHSGIRNLLLDKARVTSISYLGDVFDNVQCPGIILNARTKDDIAPDDGIVSVTSYEKEHTSLKKIRHFTASRDRLSTASFQLLSDDEEIEILKHIESVPHFTLEGNADFALGIVTGNNREFLHNEPGKGLEPIIKGKDISPFRIAPPENYVAFIPKSFQQCAPAKYYRAKEKLFYRFIASRPVVARDTTGLLSLNSANIIIPHVNGYSATYIMAILNSDVIGFYYSRTFKSLKVLRSSLEALPIPLCSLMVMHEIEDLVHRIEEGKEPKEAEKMLASKVRECYGITNDLKWRF